MPEKRKAENATVATWEDVDSALLRLVELEGDRRSQINIMESRLAEIRAAHQEGLDEIANETARLRALVEQFAREHHNEFEPQKTIERNHGILSFRTTPPAVKVLRRPWTDDERIAIVKRILGSTCIRTHEEIAKDAILAAVAAGRATSDQLADAGLRVTQREQFNLDLKRDGDTVAFGAQV